MLPPGEAPAESQEGHGEEELRGSPDEVMATAGTARTSMVNMVRDMRSRFLAAALFSIPIVPAV